MFRKTALLFFTLSLLATHAQTQTQTYKYGHMNLGNLMESMPQTKIAEDSLKLFAAQLSMQDSVMTHAFQVAYTLLEEQYNKRELTPVQVQQRQAELEKQQQDIRDFEADAQKKLDARRAKLLEPILSKIDDALKTVAKENGFAMIFDVSTGSMLFASETIDVTPLVRKKLGL